jgi:hypothetical protein
MFGTRRIAMRWRTRGAVREAAVRLAGVLGTWVWATAAAGAPPPSDLEAEKALSDLARQCVVRLVVEREGGKGAQGSGVIVSAEPGDAPQSLTVVTAYHVLYQARSVEVYSHGGAAAIVTLGAGAECFFDRSREVAVLRVKLAPGKGAGLRAIDVKKSAPVPTADGPPGGAGKRTGMVFGYSRRLSSVLDSSRVTFLGAFPAKTLDLVRPLRGDYQQGEGEVFPDQMPFQLLGDQATVKGMSGGLVVNWDREFAGLVYGRQTDQYNLIIPAYQVRRVLDRAPGRWRPLGKAFREPGVYRGSEEGEEAVEDRIDWGTLDGLTVLLGDDQLGAIDRFQEVVVTPPPRSAPKDLEIYVNPPETLPNRTHAIEIWVNGENKDLDPESMTVTLPLGELPGETMVTVIKRSGRVNDFELGRLLLPSKVDLFFQYKGERPFRRVVRSLPAITQAYPLFVTIVNDPDVRHPAEGKQPPANARVALRLDYAEAVLNQAPFALEVANDPDPKGGKAALGDASFDARFRLDEHAGWALKRVSPQRLGVTLDGRVDFQGKPLRYRDVTLKPRPGPDDDGRPPRFTVSGRFQFPYQMPGPDPRWGPLGLSLSLRATSTNGSGSLRVDVRDGLEFDLAGILRQLFTSYVNGRLIANDQPHRIADEKIAPFLDRLGVTSPGGWRASVRRAVLVHDPVRQRDWFILTLRLDPADPKGKGGTPPKEWDPLAPPGGDAPGRVIDIEAWGVPGAVAAKFPGLDPGNPAAAAALKTARADRLALTLDLVPDPKRWFLGLAPAKDLPFLSDDARSVAKRILDALAHSVKGADRLRLQATVGTGFVREALLAALNRPDVKLAAGKGEAALEVDAHRGRAGSAATLTMKGGPLELATPADAEINLGGGTTVKGVRLKVVKLAASGDFETGRVKAEVSAELSVESVKVGGETFEKASGRLTLDLDTRPGQRELGTATLEDVKLMVLFGGTPVQAQIKGKIPLKIDRDLNVTFDPKLLTGGR